MLSKYRFGEFRLAFETNPREEFFPRSAIRTSNFPLCLGERSASSSSNNPLVSPPAVSSLLTPSNDLNLNLHHFPQRITSDPIDDDDDDDDDDISQQNSTLNSDPSAR